MSIGAIKPTTSTTLSELSKDPPWPAQDLSKLRLLMDQGVSVADMARELGATMVSVREKVAALTQSAADADATAPSSAPSSVPETTNTSVGKNVDIKV